MPHKVRVHLKHKKIPLSKIAQGEEDQGREEKQFSHLLRGKLKGLSFFSDYWNQKIPPSSISTVVPR